MALLKSTRTLLRISVAALSLGLQADSAEPPALNEYQVKAVFLLNFAKFVEWPQQAFHDAMDPVTICVLGNNPFGSLLDETVQGQSISGHPVRTRVISDSRQAGQCQVVFITGAERRRIRACLDDLKGSSILTVGESEDFLSLGGIANFTLSDQRVHFEIAAETAVQRKLQISSKLLSLADRHHK